MRFVRVLVILVVAAIAAGAGGVLGYETMTQRADNARDMDEATLRNGEVIERGRVNAIAGDCITCHTAEGGADFTGGLPFDTPFGRIYSTNITPDPETGIGRYTAGMFEGALVDGAAEFWQPLYPAMPYTSYHLVSREDSDALYAYFRSLKPVVAPAKPNELPFPFNIRLLMYCWDLLFAGRGPFVPDPAKSETWNRGAYLVEGLGHCGECHTPRNALGAMIASEDLAGAEIGGLRAPDIRPATLTAAGWNREDLVTYFRSGAGPKGSAFGEMFLVVKNSLRLLPADDQQAIAVYLLDQTGDEPDKGEATVAEKGLNPDAEGKGEALYLTYCGLCHGAGGKGVPNVFPPLAGNATVGEADPFNLVTVTAKGIPAERLDETHAFGPMPAFADRLTGEEMAELATYVRARFGSDRASPSPVTGDEVDRILSVSK